VDLASVHFEIDPVDDLFAAGGSAQTGHL